MWILRKHDGDSSIPDKSGIITNKNLGDGKFAQSNHLQQFKQDVELSPRIAPIRQTWEYSIVCYSQFVLLLMDIYRLSGTGSSILLQTWCGLVCWKCRVRLDSKAHNGFPNVAETVGVPRLGELEEAASSKSKQERWAPWRWRTFHPAHAKGATQTAGVFRNLIRSGSPKKLGQIPFE